MSFRLELPRFQVKCAISISSVQGVRVKTIDCRKMSCPAPVIATKRALEEAGGDAVQILVDPGAPRENVTRFAKGRGYDVQESLFEEGFALTIGGDTLAGSGQPTGAAPARKPPCSSLPIASEKAGMSWGAC